MTKVRSNEVCNKAPYAAVRLAGIPFGSHHTLVWRIQVVSGERKESLYA